jgi:hypothetical protein
MPRWERIAFHTANGLVGATGILYAWMRYFVQPGGEFSVVNHLWQPAALHAHVLAAPLLVLMLGHFLHHHAWLARRGGVAEGRRSGLGLMILALPMIASGYLLQTATAEGWRTAWIAVHLASSAVWLAAGAAHILAHRLARRRRIRG